MSFIQRVLCVRSIFFITTLILISSISAKKFNTSHIELPSSYGKSKVASGLIYVRTGNSIVLEKPFGYADYLEKTLFTSTTQIYIGSLKKQFIAAAILKLMSEGKLDLRAPISAYLKFNTTLNAKDPTWIHHTTLHHLLTHVSEVKAAPQTSRPQTPTLSYLDRVYSESLSPRNPLKFAYNSAAYALLELVIEAISGQPAQEYITHTFLKPLNMKHTGFHASDIPNKIRQIFGNKLCYPYHFLHKQEQVVSTYDPNQARLFGAADMISTAEDLCKWNTALHSGKAFRTHPAIANRLLQLMRGLYTVDEEGDSYYGYGVKTYLRNSNTIYWHEGLVTGASVYLEYDPETDTHVIIFSNNTGVSFNSKTGTYVLEKLNDVF
ncbi:MAG: serine hydrolase domain-containing protein [Alphaproteobacteria bacterium]|nr:serine hydrolase domain-containing protein [Alphaproteobacteria bacterium]